MATVLFVDDEPNVLRAYERNLRTTGWEVLTALTAQLGLAVVETRPVDVVVSDERMPGAVSGTDLLRMVRRLHPTVMRILLTGETSLEVAARAIQDGLLYRYLTKPVKTGELVTTIGMALNMQRVLELSSTHHVRREGPHEE